MTSASATSFTLACVQSRATTDMAANLDAVEAQVRAARAKGADFIATPENVALLQRNFAIAKGQARPLDDHPAAHRFAALATELRVWLLAGSIATLKPDGRLANTSVLFDDRGAVAARYDKIHLFDVDLPDGRSYRESATYRPGDRACLAQTPWAVLGMTVCYDLRFPHLYRDLAKAGATMLSAPAAFTKLTGEAHWHVLLRARAIETGCFVFAPAQHGVHDGGYQSFGHSLIVDPWGRVLADGGEGTGVVTATIDLTDVAKVRGQIPSLAHDRPYRLDEDADAGRAAAE
ncbi:MAG: carbon-nitrogen hydrolase family protein [Alphaproteobacteria bacterium]|nr:carbon-nitrogen hydrolase family protein [Alphaproteobacteria bacterium]